MEKPFIFNSGFSKLSFFNIIKTDCIHFYNEAISAPTNINSNYATTGLNFTYIEDSDINACVWIDNSYDNILINSGTVIELFAYFYSVFSTKTFFMNIGDINKENGQIIDGCFQRNPCQIKLTGTPNCDIRYIIANITSMLACKYILSHEIGHLLNGHAYFLQDTYGINKIQMLSKSINEQNLFISLDRRTLEMDADACAATKGIDIITTLYSNRNQKSSPIKELNNPLDIFKLWGFAVHSIFLLFEKNNTKSYNEFDYYLPNAIRETLNISAAFNALETFIIHGNNNISVSEIDSIKNKMLEGIREAERYFLMRYSASFSLVQTLHNDDTTVNLVKSVLDNWNSNLVNKLQKYSRAFLYIPDKMNDIAAKYY